MYPKTDDPENTPLSWLPEEIRRPLIERYLRPSFATQAEWSALVNDTILPGALKRTATDGLKRDAAKLAPQLRRILKIVSGLVTTFTAVWASRSR